MKRSASLKRGAPLTRRTRLRAQSAKARVRAALRRAFVARILAERGGCEAPLAFAVATMTPCGGPLDVHEVLPRGRGGDPLDASNVRVICRNHHDQIHQRPVLATALGLLRSARGLP
jgi:hypothetical protein